MTGRYSLWLVPAADDPVGDRIAGLIEEHADRYDDAPGFDPHVTLVGGVHAVESEARSVASELATDHDPVDLPVAKRHCSTTTTQSVFYLVEPTEPLLELRRDARRGLDADPGMWIPHFSVVYSDLSVAERRQLVESLPTDLTGTTARGTTLELVEIVGEVEDWNWPTVERYRL